MVITIHLPLKLQHGLLEMKLGVYCKIWLSPNVSPPPAAWHYPGMWDDASPQHPTIFTGSARNIERYRSMYHHLMTLMSSYASFLGSSTSSASPSASSSALTSSVSVPPRPAEDEKVSQSGKFAISIHTQTSYSLSTYSIVIFESTQKEATDRRPQPIQGRRHRADAPGYQDLVAS